MARKPNLVPPTLLNLSLPADIHARLSLHLYSELEQRVPHGAYSRFIVDRLNEFFRSKQLDLAPYAAVDPGLFIVSASPVTLEVLKKTLKGELPHE